MPHKSVLLEDEHIEFLEEHPEVNFSALSRQTLERRMEIQELLDEISYDGVLQEIDGELRFQATSEELDIADVMGNNDVPVEIEINAIGGQAND